MRLLRFDVMRLFGYLIKRPYSLIRIKKPASIKHKLENLYS
jgi:hypothetical protein